MSTINYYFYSKINKKKWTLYTYLLQSPEKKAYLNELSDIIASNNTTTKRYLLNLSTDLEIISKSSILPGENNLYTLITNDEDNYSKCLDSYYLESSNEYLLCKILCVNNFVSVNDLIDQLAMAQTGVYKTISSLKNILEKFNLSISKNNEGYFTIDGNEINIRFFQYMFFTDTLHHGEWPFTFNKSFIKNQLSSKLLNKFETEEGVYNFLLMNAIMQNRFQQNNFLRHNALEITLYKRLETNIIDYINDQMAHTHDYYSDSIIKKLFSNKEILFVEQTVYIFFTFLLFPELNIQNIFEKQGSLLEKVNSTLSSFIREFLNELYDFLNITKPKEQYLNDIYTLFLAFILYLFLDDSNIDFLVNVTPGYVAENYRFFFNKRDIRPVRFDRISLFLDEYLSSKTNLLETYHIKNKELFVGYLTMVLNNQTIEYYSFKQSNVKIYTDFGRDTLSKKFLEKNLTELLKNHIVFVDNIQDADVVIYRTLYNKSIDDDKQYLHLENVFDLGQFSKTILTIYEKIIKSLFL